MRDNKPQVGQRVIVNNPWADKIHEGTVQSLLSIQFTFTDDDDGQIYFCNYNGDWKDNEPS